MTFFLRAEPGTRSSRSFPTPIGSSILGMILAFQRPWSHDPSRLSELDHIIAAQARRNEARSKVDGLFR